MDELSGGFFGWLSQYGGWGAAMLVLGFVGWLVLTGKLVPKTWADKIFEVNAKQAEALETYSEAWPQVLEYMQTADRFFTEMQKARDKQGGTP